MAILGDVRLRILPTNSSYLIEMEHTMQLKTSLLNPHAVYDASPETSLVIEIKAPASDIKKVRPPVCVINCVDLSGSMMGEKLDYVKKTLHLMLDHLTDNDYFSIIEFATEAFRTLPVVKISATSRILIKSAIDSLTIKGSTAFHAGLSLALDEVDKADLPKDCLVRVISLTDGQANIGPRGPDDFSKLVTHRESRASVSAFGYGHGADASVLGAIANAGKGSYSFIANPLEASSAFGSELGGLLLTSARNIKIKVKAKGNNKILKVVSLGNHKIEGDTATLSPADMIDSQVLNLVLNVKLAEQGQAIPRPVSVFEVSCNYDAIHDSTLVPTTLESDKVKVLFTKKSAEPLPVDKRLFEIVMQQESARALSDAEEGAKRNDYKFSQDALNATAKKAKDWGFTEIHKIIIDLVPKYTPSMYRSSGVSVYSNSLMNYSTSSGGYNSSVDTTLASVALGSVANANQQTYTRSFTGGPLATPFPTPPTDTKPVDILAALDVLLKAAVKDKFKKPAKK